jgi:gliding motility-associated-like protein
MPPYRVKVNNGSNSTWHNNILETPYYISVSPANSTTYFLDSMFDRTCSGTVKDSAKVIVLPFSTDSCLGSTKTFLKIYPTNNNDNVHGVVACRDNGFLVYGITNGGFGSNDLFVFKTNDTGAIIWSRNIGSTSGESGFSVKGIETRDSGFALVFDSRAFSSAEEAIFVKLNKNGQIQFQRRIGGTGLEYGRALIQTKDLGYAIGGTTASSPKSGLQDGYLVKLDASGNLQWQSNFGFAGNTTNHITDILELPFGNLIAIGAGDHKVASYVTFLVKLRPNGTVLSEKRLSLSNIETFINADITADGKIVLGGLQDVNSNDFSGQLRFLITKLDTSLNTIWTKNYLRSGSTFWGMSAIAAKDSGILIIGNERMSSRDYLTVLKVDAGGNPLWTKRFGRNNSNELTSRWAHAIKRTNDNGFIIAGNSDGFGYSRTNPVLLKINNCGGGVNCDIVNVSLTQGNVSLNNSSVTSIKTNGMQVQTAALSSNAMSFTDTVNLCYKATFDLTCAIKADFNATSSCVGQATSFVSTSSDAGNKNIVFWRWIMNDTDTINGSPAIKYAFNNAGNQKVKLIVGNNALPACYDTITKFIAISNTFGFDLSKPDTLCENDSAFVFVSNIYCQSGNVKYNWSPGRFFVDSTAQNGRFALTTSGWVKVTLTDSLQNKATDSFFVTVNTNCCKTTASFLTDKPSYCQGDTVRFINQSLTKGTTTYFWDFGNQSNPIDYVGENPPPVFFSGNGSYAVQLNVNASCGASSVTNNVYVLPVPSIDILKDTFLCQPGNVLLSQSDNLAGFSYEWLPNAGLSSVNIINPIANITNTITYKVKARNDWTACSSEDSVKISLGDLSFFSLGNDSLFCDQVNREYNYAGIADNVLWENGSNNKYRKIENPGTYNITWEIQSCKAYDTVTFNLVQMPMDSIIGEKSFCVNDSAFYSLTKSYDSVLWFDGSTNIGIFQRLGGQIGVTVFDKICSKTYSKQIEVIDLQPKIIGQTSLCEGDSTLLLANLNDVLYLWDNGSTDSFIYANRVGKVSLTVEKEGCSFSDSVLISSTPLPMPFDLGKDTVVCLDDKPFIVSPLYDTASGSTFVWDDNSRNFTRSIFDNGRYYAVAANNCGIVADSITVEFESCDCEVYVPNAFTPNRNGLNDLFLTNSCEVKSFQMLIFDRWGAKIFESDDINKGWDGKIKGDEPYNSVYVVVVNIIYTNGKRLNHKGFVNLIR